MIGKDGIHQISGSCDLCGGGCDPSAEDLNVLTCTYGQCNDRVYHQDCLEKFLKRIGCEKNRKTGFACPRGRGKAGSTGCPGRIDKSHPIHRRKEEKKAKAKPPDPAPTTKKQPAVAKDPKKKEKDEIKVKDRSKSIDVSTEEIRKTTVRVEYKNVKPAIPDTDKVKSAVDSIRRGLNRASAVEVPSTVKTPREVFTLDEYEAMKSNSSSCPASGAAKAVAAMPSAPSPPSLNSVWGTKPLASQDSDKPSPLLASAFPSIPGVKPVTRPGQGEMTKQRSWAKSVSVQDAVLTSQDDPSGLPCVSSPLPTLAAQERSVSFRQAPSVRSRPEREAHQQQGHAVQVHNLGTGAVAGGRSAIAPGSRLSTSTRRLSQTSSSSSHVGSSCGLSTSMGASDDTWPGLSVDAHAGAGSKTAKGKHGAALSGAQQGACLTDVSSEAAGGMAPWMSESPHLHECLAQLGRFKSLCCLQSLVGMGFDRSVSVAAMQQVGADWDRAVDWILRGNTVQQLSGCMSNRNIAVDVSAEMETVEQVLGLLPLTVDEVHCAIIAAEGDLYEALSNLLESMESMISDQRRRDSEQRHSEPGTMSCGAFDRGFTWVAPDVAP